MCISDSGKEILSMDQILTYLLKSSKPLVKESDLPALVDYPQLDWNNFVDTVRGSIATYPGKVRVGVNNSSIERNISISVLKFKMIFSFIQKFY